MERLEPGTERERQKQACKGPYLYRWHYICDDGASFSAIAPSEAGAFRVLNAERPGMRARFTGATNAGIWG
jgi:hypothetical protein